MLVQQEQCFDTEPSGCTSGAAAQVRSVDEQASAQERAIGFGRFTLYPSARLLLRDGAPVCIGGRAFDLLVILLRSPGQVVTKQEITRHVWPTTYVEESNLRFQVGCLRRALGNNGILVKSIAGRGYLLTADHMPGELPASVQPRNVPDDCAKDEILDAFLRTAATLVSNYGSLEAFLGALAAHHR